MTLVRSRQDRVRRAVVLLERDHLRVREVVLELEDVADVGSSEGVDRVVGHEPVGDEVVRPLDVEVVHRRFELDLLDVSTSVELAVLADHHHARPDRGRGHERQRVASLPIARVGAARRAVNRTETSRTL